MDGVRFETPEDVALEFELAGPGSRMAASIIDHLLLAVLVFILLGIGAATGVLAIRLEELFDPQAVAEMASLTLILVLIIVTTCHLFYFVICEWLLSGQSLGKRWLGLRVVKDGGYALGLGASLLRNLFRIVDFLPGLYVVGFLALMVNDRNKRLGDLVAGSIVVRHHEEAAPEPRFVGERYSNLPDRRFTLTREHLAALDAETLELLDGYFDRADALEGSAREGLTRSLSRRLAARMGFYLSEESDEAEGRAFLKETYLALREQLEHV